MTVPSLTTASSASPPIDAPPPHHRHRRRHPLSQHQNPSRCRISRSLPSVAENPSGPCCHQFLDPRSFGVLLIRHLPGGELGGRFARQALSELSGADKADWAYLLFDEMVGQEITPRYQTCRLMLDEVRQKNMYDAAERIEDFMKQL
ncbi:uncharacterized protein LOC120291318 [Eucalyptus grandis]|uniref:uncharacterized protein LOC120291318 n=1 Tax=Eucalyptus grandis TaxID=71139 RepID=UPI00192ED32E|nr:uncharacterized protein LOC120291318 [Eucalyptus grandis]